MPSNDDGEILAYGDIETEAHSQGQDSSSHLLETSRVPSKSASALVRRVRALILRLVPKVVEEESITGSEGIISGKVVNAFALVGGDLAEATPYALLEARKTFLKDAVALQKQLNEQRALACEIVAIRLVGESEFLSAAAKDGYESSYLSLSKQFTRYEDDGDETLPTSALESAVDQDAVRFLSCPQAQICVRALWTGRLVRKYGSDGQSYFAVNKLASSHRFLDHLDPSRLAVPRNMYYVSIVSFVFYLVLYTISTRTYKSLDVFEILLWIWSVGLVVEDIGRWIKIQGLDAIQFWVFFDVASDTLLAVSFFLRIASFFGSAQHKEEYQLRAFQVLACVSPLLWLQLLKVGDGFKYMGTISVVIFRMIRETSIFAILLLINGVGFSLALWALDAADGHRIDNAATVLMDAMISAFLGSPAFEVFEGARLSLMLYYLYTFTAVLILANVLVALFSSAYEAVTDNADDIYAGHYAGKVVDMLRAPDEFVYVTPVNLLEVFLLAPLEYVLPRAAYIKLNRTVQWLLFSGPLLLIALYEVHEERVRASWSVKLLGGERPEQRDRDVATAAGQQGTVEDPDTSGDAEDGSALVVSRVPFEKLVAKLPRQPDEDDEKTAGTGDDTTDSQDQSGDLRAVLAELQALRREVQALRESTPA